ncbi:MAG: hypothetical protein M3Z74_01090 [Pseudomonadota bacterium]|nr:hypothetical protein [Pseudomonadota bacterium]
MAIAPPVAGSAILTVCPLFPIDNVWNTAIDTLPVDANSNAYVATIGAARTLHPDFGTVYAGAPNGIPFITVRGSQAKVPVSFTYAGESDPGPYPVPPNAPIEGGPQAGGDRHVLVLDCTAGKLYELFAAYPNPDGSWAAGSGAVFDVLGNSLRPPTWTSADAAGLPILAGLVIYEQVVAGEIAHALRFTAPQTRNAFIWPARHQASALSGTQYPPMGQRFRLKASVDISGFGPNVKVILRALKKYGMFLADNGSSWYLSGAPDPRWDDNELHQLGLLHGSDFEAVDESSLMIDPNSGQARPPTSTQPAAGKVSVVEYYRAAVGHYFMTIERAEIDALDNGTIGGWARTGQTFEAYPPYDASHAPVCRFYGRPEAGLDSHFFSASISECQAVIARFSYAWIYESGNVFTIDVPDPVKGACAPAAPPVYRLYNNRADVNHRYTTSLALRARMINAGWITEGYGPLGVAMCAAPE